MGIAERIFLDAKVLLHAFKGQQPLAGKCAAILNRTGIVFLSSTFLKLELLPIPQKFNPGKEQDFLNYPAYTSSIRTPI